jgi:hypothetical protein
VGGVRLALAWLGLWSRRVGFTLGPIQDPWANLGVHVPRFLAFADANMQLIFGIGLLTRISRAPVRCFAFTIHFPHLSNSVQVRLHPLKQLESLYPAPSRTDDPDPQLVSFFMQL